MFRSSAVCFLLLFLPLVSLAQAAKPASPELVWRKYSRNPLVPAVGGTWHESSTGSPEVLLAGDKYYLYFSGQIRLQGRIGVGSIPRKEFDGFTWSFQRKPVIEPGPAGAPDDSSCLHPSAVRVKGQTFLYYTGSNTRGERSICLALSKDGLKFTKYQKNPVMKGAVPEVVYHKNTFYMFFHQQVPGKEGYQIHYATSKDGYNFSAPSPAPVLAPGPDTAWDSYSVETPRIFNEGGLFYMVYSGSDRFKDYPSHAGLATSRDLVRWTKYARNPIFSRGYPGTWDEGAVWSVAIEKFDGVYYMWYQGYGGGTHRDQPYSHYLDGGKTQVGEATLEMPYFYVKPRR